jgi:hypothetical protein
MHCTCLPCSPHLCCLNPACMFALFEAAAACHRGIFCQKQCNIEQESKYQSSGWQRPRSNSDAPTALKNYLFPSSHSSVPHLHLRLQK